MQTKILTALFLFAALGATQDVDVDDVPRACQQACQDISSLSDDCDNQTDDDTAERDCVCNANNALQQATSCAACVKANVQNNNDDDDEEDIRELFSACGWDYAGVSATSSGTASSTGSVITTTQTFPASTTTATSSGITTTETFPASTVTTTGSASPSSTETQTPDSAGAGVTAGVGIIAAGLMAALPIVL
ncbi:hypothetical protein O1611_g4054 [Lasiodiplodia mahajangana]|uniref:Uncharacterized protein n=1 Tax=Lasiodiplodia mahajangana TaxID=1108764 RepID=A0ACC2JQW8_9PEZI|nr:hypothetical protein O1611_g4054 [Lasiodiplodia mahajangana]